MLTLSFLLVSFFLEFKRMEILQLDVGKEYTCYREARHPDSEIDTQPF